MIFQGKCFSYLECAAGPIPQTMDPGFAQAVLPRYIAINDISRLKCYIAINGLSRLMMHQSRLKYADVNGKVYGKYRAWFVS